MMAVMSSGTEAKGGDAQAVVLQQQHPFVASTSAGPSKAIFICIGFGRCSEHHGVGWRLSTIGTCTERHICPALYNGNLVQTNVFFFRKFLNYQ